ncbi:MAG: Molybdenum cofactor guanylyltransferase [bacterium]|nr:Molybdenum cofactor guanylyltransferase [bacterium]
MKGAGHLGVLGAVLAGGKSRRMGVPKEGVVLADGRAMIEHVLDSLRPVCGRLAVVGECRGWRIPSEIPHIPDLEPGQGPLGGIEALLASGLAGSYLVVTCDQPLLKPELLKRLIEKAAGGGPVFIRPFAGRELDPFPGVFPDVWLPAIHAALEEGRRGVREFLLSQAVEWVEVSEAEVDRIRSFNSPEEVAELRKR